jgi:hypothetical protein
MDTLYKSIIVLSIVGLILAQVTLAQETIKAPETLEQAQEFGEELLRKTKQQLPDILQRTWQEDVLPVWRKMKQIWSKWWDTTIQPWLISIVDRIKVLLGQEIEKRKPYIEKELEKETKELIKDIEKEIPKTKSLWKRFKELLQ